MTTGIRDFRLKDMTQSLGAFPIVQRLAAQIHTSGPRTVQRYVRVASSQYASASSEGFALGIFLHVDDLCFAKQSCNRQEA